MGKSRLPVREDVFDEAGNLIEVILDGQRYYPPVSDVMSNGVHTNVFRPILTPDERAERELGILNMIQHIRVAP